MNADAMLPNIGLIDDHQHYNSTMQYYNTDQNNYMSSSNCNTLVLPQMVDNNGQQPATMQHYMSPKSTTNLSKSHMNASHVNNLDNMNRQAYSHNMSPMGTQMNSHNHLLNSQIARPNQNSNGSQLNYCKMPAVSISNQYETPPLPRAYQHHSSSSSSNADLNQFNAKYHPDSNENVSVSTTLTHISETDSHPHSNFSSNSPQAHSHSNLSVTNNSMNMLSNLQTFSSAVCNPSSNWNTLSSDITSMNSQIKCGKNSNANQNTFSSQNDSHFQYLDQPNTDFLSITSTPMNSQPPTDHYLMRRQSKNTTTQNCVSKSQCNSAISRPNNFKVKPTLSNNETPNFKKNFVLAEKRTVVFLKVIEQIIDPVSQGVLKQTIVKNEEVSTSCGHVQFDTTSNDTTTTDTSISRSHIGSSGNFADISALSTTKSANTLSSERSLNSMDLRTNELRKSDFTFDNSPVVAKSENSKNKQDAENVDKNEEEEERRQTASALLALQTASNTNTPVKDFDQSKISEKMLSESDLNSAITSGLLIAAELKENSRLKSNDSTISPAFPICEKLRPGIKVMAKWKDKNFYPAEIVKQVDLAIHKWSVKFEDSATRNLFETEIIRIEHMLRGQDVMLTLSDDLCVRVTIKQAYLKNMKNIEFDLEMMENDKMVSKKYKLKDIFLNAEQGSTILTKVSKPIFGNAVFADVDLDNIVAGKRSRAKQTNEVNENANSTSISKKKPDDSSANSDSDLITNKRKRKLNEETRAAESSNSNKAVSIESEQRKKSDTNLESYGHYHESSLSLSPRSSKSHLNVPQHELEKILGPMPKNNSKFFARMDFMLTSGDRRRSIFGEHESTAERSTPFDKAYLAKQIVAGGGKVFDTFEEMKASNDNFPCALVTDTYHRSIKYIQCLAAGIPIVSHLWVIESCRAGKLLDRDSYLLPAGFSIITHSLSSDRNTFKKSAVLFKGTKFYFGSTFWEKLQKLWAPVLFAAQASIVKHEENMHTILTRKLVDIIIADESCKNDLVMRAKQLRIPVVSSEFIVQCLINGKRLQFDQSPYFSHSYKEQVI